MSRTEWDEHASLKRLFAILTARSREPSVRKLRLFIAACLQRLRVIPLDAPSLAVVNAYTRFATHGAPRAVFGNACHAIYEANQNGHTSMLCWLANGTWHDTPEGAERAATDISWAIAGYAARDSLAQLRNHATEEDQWLWGFTGPPDANWLAARLAEEEYQTGLLRHIVGNPFRCIQIDENWLTSHGNLVRSLAEGIYEQWACPRMPILADALEDAGCADAYLLDHLRGPGPHVRGCWALDLLLGKQ